MISALENKNRALDTEKRDTEAKAKQELDYLQRTSQEEIENLNNQCIKYKSELAELSTFSRQKTEIEEQLKQSKQLLDRKEHDYRDTIHNLERKVLQDKVSEVDGRVK